MSSDTETRNKKAPMQEKSRKVLNVKWAQYSPVNLMEFLKLRRIRLSAKPNRYGGVTVPPIREASTLGT